MRCYQEAAARLGQNERPALDMGLDGEAVETLPELVKKPPGTPLPPGNDAESASGERRQQERRPSRASGPARNHLAEPGERPCRRPRKPGTGHDGRRGGRAAGRGIEGTEKQVAIKDAHHIVIMLDEFTKEELHKYLPGPDRDYLLLCLKNVERIIKEGK